MGRRNSKKQSDNQIEQDERAAERKERGIGDNVALTEDEQRALLFSHWNKLDQLDAAVTIAQAAVTKAKAEVKAAKQLAIAEYGPNAVQDIADLRLLQMEKGGEAAKANMERLAKLSRWLNLPLGTQVSFLDEDVRSVLDIAYEAGKIAGLKGEDCRPPYDTSVPQYQKWIEGWHDGQDVLLSDWRAKMQVSTPQADTPPAPPEGEQGDLEQAISEADAGSIAPDLADKPHADIGSPPFIPGDEPPTTTEH